MARKTPHQMLALAGLEAAQKAVLAQDWDELEKTLDTIQATIYAARAMADKAK